MRSETAGGETAQRILLVDDLPANLELLSGMLKGRGYETRAALSGAAALQAAKAERPDLILLDIKMPGMDGYEVCGRLKADEATRDIPVIFISALNETFDKVKAFSAGGVDYISTPFQFEEVEARVRTHLELRRQRLELQENYARLREMEKMRAGLVRMIVHDLRIPLSVITSSIDLARRDPQCLASGPAAENMEEAGKAAGIMMRMVSDLLDASRMESGKMELNLADCDLQELLRQAADYMRPLAGRRQVSVIPSAEPVNIRADAQLLSRVLQNLIANAIKYSPREGGYVRLAASREKDAVRVTVANNGPDIPAEYHQKIFEKYGQVDAAGVRQPYSTGLGLNFCKLAVELHGGRIGVESAPGKPTVFWTEFRV